MILRRGCCAFIAVALMTANGATSAYAAGASTPAANPPAKAAVSGSSVIVRLGDAMLEEYYGGDPAKRTTVIRGGDSEQVTKSAESGKKHS